MNILSLFDGISCGQTTLNRLNIPITNYFASEIDKYAITITNKNYPNTIQLGDVKDIDVASLPKIDLLIGGSPCQSFTFAGKRNGMITKDNVEITTLEQYLSLKSEGFQFEGQSYLFTFSFLQKSILFDSRQVSRNYERPPAIFRNLKF